MTKEGFEQQIDGLEWELLEREAEVLQLLERERELDAYKNTPAYQKALRKEKRKNAFFPEGSRRKTVMKLMRRALKKPTDAARLLFPGNFSQAEEWMRIEAFCNKEKYRTIKADEALRKELEHMCRACDGRAADRNECMVSPEPTVSIILTGDSSNTGLSSCLYSIRESNPTVPFEIIEDPDRKKVEKAGGKYLLFLGTNTWVKEGWLDSLVDLLERDSAVGLAGSKLIYPDGRLQEAGGIVWRNGIAWSYGNLQNPSNPEFNYIKRVDYVSAVSFIIRRDIWRRTGEVIINSALDVWTMLNLAFTVRDCGYQVVYQPGSEVVHFGEIFGSPDKIQARLEQVWDRDEERKQFCQRWKAQLASAYELGENVFRARERRGEKKCILVIDQHVPQYDQDAGSKTVFQYIKMFVHKGFLVKFLGRDFRARQPYTSVLEQLGVEVLHGAEYYRGSLSWIQEHQKDIDYIYMNRPQIARYYLGFLKDHTSIRRIYYGHDLHFLRLYREYELTGDEAKKKESDDLKQIELDIMRNFDMNYYPSYVEVEKIHDIDPDISVKAITAYVYEEESSNTADFAEREGILFVGGFDHTPNRDAIHWFMEQIYPQICERQVIPFYIAGSRPTPEIEAYQSSSVTVMGFVTEEELRELYGRCRIVVAPLRFGAGIKGKVIEALHYGLPIVTTTIGAEGIAASREVMVAENNERNFAQYVIALYNDIERLEKMSQRAREYTREYFSEEAVWSIIAKDFC